MQDSQAGMEELAGWHGRTRRPAWKNSQAGMEELAGWHGRSCALLFHRPDHTIITVRKIVFE